jgi:hypothetical protein
MDFIKETRMTRSYFMAGCVLLLASALSAHAAAAKEAVKAKNPKEAKEKLLSSGLLLGRITTLDGDARTLTVQVTLQYLVADEDAVAQEVDLRGQLTDALQIEDPGERFQRVREVQAEILANRANLLRVEETQQDVALQLVEDVKVRVANPPPVFDDKGRARKYTVQELKDLKGPGNLIGYTADFSDLKEGQTVRVSAARKKMSAKEIRAAVQAGEEIGLLATLVVIVAQPEE